MTDKQEPIQIDPEILSGAACFAGTRVPVATLMDYLKAGDRVDEFLDDFPTVSREQVAAVLEIARDAAQRSRGMRGVAPSSASARPSCTRQESINAPPTPTRRTELRTACMEELLAVATRCREQRQRRTITPFCPAIASVSVFLYETREQPEESPSFHQRCQRERWPTTHGAARFDQLDRQVLALSLHGCVAIPQVAASGGFAGYHLNGPVDSVLARDYREGRPLPVELEQTRRRYLLSDTGPRERNERASRANTRPVLPRCS